MRPRPPQQLHGGSCRAERSASRTQHRAPLATASGSGNARSQLGPSLDERRVDAHPDSIDEFRGHGSRTGDGDLLSDDRPHERLERVDAARRTTAGNRANELTEKRVRTEVTIDGDGIGVEVEHPPDALDRSHEVRPVTDTNARDDVIEHSVQR